MRPLHMTVLAALVPLFSACGGATQQPAESGQTDTPSRAEIDALARDGAQNLCPIFVACGTSDYRDVAECETRWAEETATALAEELARRPTCARERLESYRCLLTQPSQCEPGSPPRPAPADIAHCDAVETRLYECLPPPVEEDGDFDGAGASADTTL